MMLCMLWLRQQVQQVTACREHLPGPAVAHPGIATAGLQRELHAGIADTSAHKTGLAQLNRVREPALNQREPGSDLERPACRQRQPADQVQ